MKELKRMIKYYKNNDKDALDAYIGRFSYGALRSVRDDCICLSMRKRMSKMDILNVLRELIEERMHTLNELAMKDFLKYARELLPFIQKYEDGAPLTIDEHDDLCMTLFHTWDSAECYDLEFEQAFNKQDVTD